MLNKEEIKKILDTNEEIITYKADKDFRCLTGTERKLLENNNKIKQYIVQLETDKQNLIEKLEETRNNLEKDGFIGYADEIKEILEILKGETNDNRTETGEKNK